MIPLDGTGTKPGVAKLFREASEWVSLCIHGNDHTYRELAGSRTEADCRKLLAQALRRVRRTEERHGVSFCRVMEAPHGVIHHRMFPALVSLGFEGATFTPGQFLGANSDRVWSAACGWQAQEWFPGGLQAIPRILMSRQWRMDVGWAAWLEQPVVVAGHHWDAEEGLGFLGDLASTLNRWGSVNWGGVSRVVRTNYLSRLERGLFAVKTAGRNTWVDVPAEGQELAVERQWLAGEATEPLRIVERATGRVLVEARCGRYAGPWRIRGSAGLSILSPPADGLSADEVVGRGFRVWPYLRRGLSELRERARPLLPRRNRAASRRPQTASATNLVALEPSEGSVDRGTKVAGVGKPLRQASG